MVPGSGTVVVVTSTLQLSSVEVSNESIRTSESVQGPSTVLLLNSARVWVAVVGEFRSALNELTARPSG